MMLRTMLWMLGSAVGLTLLLILALIVYLSEKAKQSQASQMEAHREPEPPASEPEAPSRDDLKVIEGIGPVMERVLNEAGILTYRDLASHTPEELQAILDRAGVARITNPETWAEQAKLAAEGRWEELKALQATLKGGRRRA